MAEALLEHKAEIERRSLGFLPFRGNKKWEGDTPLRRAAGDGRLDVVELLIERGADVGAATTDGETPLSLTRRVEEYEYNPWFQDTRETVKSFNEQRRKEIETANANRLNNRGIDPERIAEKPTSAFRIFTLSRRRSCGS